jgi:hypothetical protein
MWSRVVPFNRSMWCYSISMQKAMKKGRRKPYKWWVSGVFTLLILIFTLVVWREEKSGGSCYETNSPPTQDDSAMPGSLSRDDISKKQETPQKADKTSTNSESYLCRLIAPANLPNIYLVLIGIGGILAAVYTLEIISQQARSMRYQTTHLRNSVIAAQRSADAYISGERAWVVGELVPLAVKYSDGRWYRFVENKPVGMSDTEVAAGQHLQYTLRLTNLGRTPAFIVKYEIYCFWIKTPKELIDFGQPYHFVAGGSSWDAETFSISEYVRTATDTNQVFLHVILSYQHVFSKMYVAEEQFAYVFSVEHNMLQRIIGIPDTYEKQRQDEIRAN